MNDVLANIYQLPAKEMVTVAPRLDHAAVFDPLVNNPDRLNGLRTWSS